MLSDIKTEDRKLQYSDHALLYVRIEDGHILDLVSFAAKTANLALAGEEES